MFAIIFENNPAVQHAFKSIMSIISPHFSHLHDIWLKMSFEKKLQDYLINIPVWASDPYPTLGSY